jgi:hypothetical protein
MSRKVPQRVRRYLKDDAKSQQDIITSYHPYSEPTQQRKKGFPQDFQRSLTPPIVNCLHENEAPKKIPMRKLRGRDHHGTTPFITAIGNTYLIRG